MCCGKLHHGSIGGKRRKMQDEILEKVIRILGEYTEVEEIQKEREILDELELSSVEVFSMLSDLEEEFDINIPEKIVRKIVTVEDLCNEIALLL